MELGGNNSGDPKKGVEVATLALRNAYPAGIRSWGMRITVYADPTATNNRTYELTYNYTSTSKSDNANWVDSSLASADVVTSKTRKKEFPIDEHSGVVNGSNAIISDLQDGESVSGTFHYTGKDDDTNTSVGGLFAFTWSKQAGAFVKAAEASVYQHNNLGQAVTVSTSQAGGIISLAVGLASGAMGNFSYSGYVTLIYRKAA